jgi:GNAT superfamily N-acetyltransferase
MNIQIREAAVADAPLLAGLSVQLGYPATASEIEERLNAMGDGDKDVVFVAVLEEVVFGWIHVFCTLRLESGIFGEIGGLVVDENHRGKGIGRLLVEKAKEWSLKSGLSKLRVRCNAVRVEAHYFYLRQEFNEVKEQKVFELRL